MDDTINIYCDESCHLLNDGQDHMVIGGVWAQKNKIIEINERIKNIKIRHGFNPAFEIKWTKVSGKRLDFYLDVLDYFFDNDDLHFRSIIVKNKKKLDHEKYNHTHNDFYYKIYFSMLKTILNPDSEYNIYMDIKDDWGGKKIGELHSILSNNMYDFNHKIIKKIQIVRSHETGIMQICDLLIGAMSYLQRSLKESDSKLSLIQKIKDRSGYTLEKTTLVKEGKFNLFFWEPSFYGED